MKSLILFLPLSLLVCGVSAQAATTMNCTGAFIEDLLVSKTQGQTQVSLVWNYAGGDAIDTGDFHVKVISHIDGSLTFKGANFDMNLKTSATRGVLNGHVRAVTANAPSELDADVTCSLDSGTN